MFMRMQYTESFRRIRGTLQILMTLVSFFGFNEAVLAERYRSSLRIQNDNARMIVVKNPVTEPLKMKDDASGCHSGLISPTTMTQSDTKTKVVVINLHPAVF